MLDMILGSTIALLSAALGATLPLLYAHRQYRLAERRRAAEYLLDWVQAAVMRLQDLEVMKGHRLKEPESEEQATKYRETKDKLRELLLSSRPSFMAFLGFGDGIELESTRRLQLEFHAVNRLLVNAREDWDDCKAEVDRRFASILDSAITEYTERLADQGRLPASLREMLMSKDRN